MILRSIEWLFRTDVSGQPIDPIFKVQALTLKMGPISCSETSVRNHHSTLRNIPKERRFHLCRSQNDIQSTNFFLICSIKLPGNAGEVAIAGNISHG